MQVVDLNVCLYAVNKDSVLHSAAKGYLEEALNSEEPVAFAWAVILGFMRIATNPRIFPKPLTASQAMSVIDGWRQTASRRNT